LKLEYQTTQRSFKTGETAVIRFKVSDPVSGAAKPGLADLRVLTFLSPGRSRTELPTKDLGDGVYEARIPLSQSGGWYVYVGVPSLKLGYDRLPFYSLVAEAPATVAKKQ
jgi:hypothetical protein